MTIKTDGIYEGSERIKRRRKYTTVKSCKGFRFTLDPVAAVTAYLEDEVLPQ